MFKAIDYGDPGDEIWRVTVSSYGENKIGYIKAIREAVTANNNGFGFSLKEAKDLAERPFPHVYECTKDALVTFAGWMYYFGMEGCMTSQKIQDASYSYS